MYEALASRSGQTSLRGKAITLSGCKAVERDVDVVAGRHVGHRDKRNVERDIMFRAARDDQLAWVTPC